MKTRSIVFFALWAFSAASFAQETGESLKPENMQVASNGIFLFTSTSAASKAHSDNGRFWCDYEIGEVGDETRELKNFAFYEGETLLYTLDEAPGADMYISNSGFTAFMDMELHFEGKLSVHFHSKTGRHLFSRVFKGASLFGFSGDGNLFGVGAAESLQVISLPANKVSRYPKGFQFDLSDDGEIVAIAARDKIIVYTEGEFMREIKTDFLYTRRIKISSEHHLVAVIDKRRLKVFSLENGELLFVATLNGKSSFRDLELRGDAVLTGVHFRDKGISKGVLKAYTLKGEVLLEREESVKRFKVYDNTETLHKTSSYRTIPWPFAPFDSMYTIWNSYEQSMGSYLHNGIDLITPIGEPTYAVEGGYVKCVLTIRAYHHWRIAISKEQTEKLSKGWLYAHLIESTIQFDVGDTVQMYDYLGDIVQWGADWGHIHFVEIQDSSLVWQYDQDNGDEWSVTYNPLLSLYPNTDICPPTFENISDTSKFAFCINETSIYLDPDSLFGKIDIIACIQDQIGGSPFSHPAYETYYWVKEEPDDELVLPKTLGQRLNHSYPFYEPRHYIEYTSLIFKGDAILQPTVYADTTRFYYHILTNSDGDTILDLSEKELAFITTNYLDGDYKIFIEARDAYGNATVDSMLVKFKNKISADLNAQNLHPNAFELGQNYPNPCNPATHISYSIPQETVVTLKVFNTLGREIKTLVHAKQMPGEYSVIFTADNLASGIYLYSLHAGNFSDTKKLLLLH